MRSAQERPFIYKGKAFSSLERVSAPYIKVRVFFAPYLNQIRAQVQATAPYILVLVFAGGLVWRMAPLLSYRSLGSS